MRMWLLHSRAAGFVASALTEAIGLWLGAWLLPGTTIDARGLLIATAVIAVPGAGLDWYIGRDAAPDGRPKHLARSSVAFLLIIVWMFASLAVADWATPHFNIGGAWQYIVLWLIILAVALVYWKFLKEATAEPAGAQAERDAP